MAESAPDPVREGIVAEILGRMNDDLNLGGLLPVARYIEYLTPAPYIEQIITEPFLLDAEGYLTIPTRPGWGT